MKAWARFWFALLCLIRSVGHANRLVTLYHQAKLDEYKYHLVAKRLTQIHQHGILTLRKLEEQAAEADLLLPSSKTHLLELTRSHMVTFVETRKTQLMQEQELVKETNHV